MEKNSTTSNKTSSVGGINADGEVCLTTTMDPATTSFEDIHGQYKRTVSSRQVHVISLGANIGSGLLIATGKGLNNAGPLGALLAYGMVTVAVWAVLQVLGEMTIAFPTSGNFIDYADRFVDPSIAFAAGFAEWLGWCAVVGAEATFFSLIINQWANGSVSEAVWITVYLACAVALFCLPNKWFARFEYCVSVLKLFGITLFLILDFAIILGAGPKGKIYHGETWQNSNLFNNGFGGFSSAALLALWAMADQVFTTIMAGEAESPRLSISRAAKTVPVRVSVLYILTVLFSSLLISSNDPRLFGGSSPSQSPFAIAMADAGIPGLDQLLRVIILLSCFGFGAESIYVASRIVRALSHQGLIPEILASKVDSKGRPVWALIITGVTTITLTYINLSSTGTTIFTWLVSITSSAFFIVWIIISITSFRFHAAITKHKDPLFSNIFAWRCWAWPLPTIVLLVISVFLFICCIYSGLYPLGSTQASVENFFQYNIGVVIVIAFTVAHKLWYRTRLRRLSEVNLVTGRRVLEQDEISMLHQYYSRPAWRRAISYFKFW